jgi:hypothetical protein
MKTFIAFACALLLVISALQADTPATRRVAPVPENVEVELRTYNISDLVRSTPDYPFNSAIIPPNLLDRQTKALPAGGGGGGASESLFGTDSSAKGAKSDSESTMSAENLSKTISEMVAPDTWRDAGGDIGSIRFLGGVMIISQTADNHKKIDDLLKMIRSAYGPLKMITVKAYWIMLEPDQIKELMGTQPANGAVQVVDPATVAKFGQGAHWCQGATSCFNGQTVHISSGRGRTVITAAEPVVGSSAALYSPKTSLVQAGAVLQVMPLLSPDGKTAVLDVSSVASTWGKLETVEVGPVNAKNVTTASTAIDRMNVGVQELRTTLRIPVGKLVLVGGMTMEPAGDTTDSGKQLYLLAEVTAAD